MTDGAAVGNLETQWQPAFTGIFSEKYPPKSPECQKVGMYTHPEKNIQFPVGVAVGGGYPIGGLTPTQEQVDALGELWLKMNHFCYVELMGHTDVDWPHFLDLVEQGVLIEKGYLDEQTLGDHPALIDPRCGFSAMVTTDSLPFAIDPNIDILPGMNAAGQTIVVLNEFKALYDEVIKLYIEGFGDRKLADGNLLSIGIGEALHSWAIVPSSCFTGSPCSYLTRENRWVPYYQDYLNFVNKNAKTNTPTILIDPEE